MVGEAVAVIKKSNLSFSDRHALEVMGKDLNSKPLEYAGIDYTDEPEESVWRDSTFKDMDHFINLKNKYSDHPHPAVRKAFEQIQKWTQWPTFESTQRDEEGNKELHYLIKNSDSSNVPELTRAIFRYSKLSESHPDISKIYRPGKIIKLKASATSSDPTFTRDRLRGGHVGILLRNYTPEEMVDSPYYEHIPGPRIAPVIMHFPKKTQAIQIAPLSGHLAGQNEYITAPGRFKVTRTEGPDEDGIHHVYLEPHHG